MKDTEARNKTDEWGEWFNVVANNVPVAVVMSAASMEALGNEIIQNYLDQAKTSATSKARVQLLKELLDRRSGQPYEKFDQIALIMDRHLPKGTKAWEDVAMLQSLRNVFMHFKPSWDDESVSGEKAVKNVIQRAGGGGCKLFPKDYPSACFTYPVARWAVQAVPAFSRYFSTELGIDDILGRGDDFSLN